MLKMLVQRPHFEQQETKSLFYSLSLPMDDCTDLDTVMFIVRGSVMIFRPSISNLQLFGSLAKWEHLGTEGAVHLMGSINDFPHSALGILRPVLALKFCSVFLLTSFTALQKCGFLYSASEELLIMSETPPLSPMLFL